MVPEADGTPAPDVALREITDGKISYENVTEPGLDDIGVKKRKRG